MHEMPQLVASSYASNTVDVAQAMQMVQQQFDAGEVERRLRVAAPPPPFPNFQHMQKELAPMAISNRRLVQVFIADPDENVPLADCLLYQGDQKLTDLTDQELFFEVDIKSILDAHNAKRVTLVNKAVKERTEHLEPARIRDLKMTVVTIAQF